DPAVVVVDEDGRFAISVLSGHFGANDLTKTIAKGIKAKPIITTATDVQDKPSVETLAREFNLEIEDFEHAKEINAAIVNDKKVCIFSDFELGIGLPENMSFSRFKELKSNGTNYDAIIIITNKRIGRLVKCNGTNTTQHNRKDLLLCSLEKPYVVLRPKKLILGIGSRKGIGKREVLEAINYAMKKAGLSIKSIKTIATINFKAKEKGIVEAAGELNTPLKSIDVKDVKEIEERFDRSEHVREKVGVGAVSEPVAVLAGENTRLIHKKIKRKGVTVAIAEDSDRKLVRNAIFLAEERGN
ncbi:MAG: cobalamin biosynthesis protein, partial [Candidatus Hydrothermarchaeota archaeon]|nr:cobalamin biosynthesis protein [Candidatus Hydrothermarchaeota archaeon]